MSILDEILLEQAARTAWTSDAKEVPHEAQSENFRDCYESGFFKGVIWLLDRLKAAKGDVELACDPNFVAHDPVSDEDGRCPAQWIDGEQCALVRGHEGPHCTQKDRPDV